MAMSLVLVAVFAAGYLVRRSQRRITLLAGLLCVPFCLYEFAFIPEYWTPTIVGGFKVGPDDFMFSFATGGIAWMIGLCGIRDDVAIHWQPCRFTRRFVGGSLLGVMLSLVLWSLGLRIMNAVLVCIALGLAVLSWRYPRFHGLSLAGSVGFLLAYALVLRGVLSLSPGFAAHWNARNLSGVSLLGIPAEEALWALSFGAIWPRFVAYVFDARPVPRAR